MYPHFGVQTSLGLLCVLYMIYRAKSRKSLTPSGIVAAALVGTIHAIHPFRIIVLLLTFFLCGTKLTHWGSEIKAEILTDDSDSASDNSPANQQKGEVFDAASPRTVQQAKQPKGRTAVQVFCNSLPATSLALLHLFTDCRPLRFSHEYQDLLVFGIVAQYACSAADTFSSEIGVLNDGWPFLITTFRKVPPGTNGGVSLLGLIAALMGGSIIGLCALVIPTDTWITKLSLVLIGTGAGLFGSLADSILGATMQQTVYNTEMRKVVEVHGGAAVKKTAKHADKEKYIVFGHDVLDNNQVNLASAVLTVAATIGTVGVCSYVWHFFT